MNSKLSALKIYIVPILVIVTIVLLVPLVLMPQLENIKEKNVELKKATEGLESLKTKLAALNAIDENDESLKLIEMETVVPSGKELAQIVVGVRSIAAQSNLFVAEMVFKPGKVATGSATASAAKKVKADQAKTDKEEDKDKLTFSTILRGSLSNVNKFLGRIEKAKRLLGISIIETKKEEKANSYSFDFEIAAPFTQVEPKADIVSAPLPELTSEHLAVYDFVTGFTSYTNVSIPQVPTGVKDPFR